MSLANSYATTTISRQYLPVCYGSFSSTQIQLIPATTATPIGYDTADIIPVGCGCPLGGSPDITVVETGTYKVLASIQIDKTTAGIGDVDTWIEVAGVPVPNSATKLSINQNIESLMTVEWFVQCQAGDTIQIYMYSAVAGFRALAVAAAPPVPAIPSIITTVYQIG
jgi:hypothetical protein